MNSQTNNHKRFFIHTLGCKVNQYESQVMREMLVKAGFKECISREMADIYILNTCTVTERSDRESRYWVSFFHKANPKARIVVTGCYAEMHADKLSFLPGISNIIKNADKGRIADIINGEVDAVVGHPTSVPAPAPFFSITDFKGHTKAFVKIQDGCENQCAYCKVPMARGILRSKPVAAIIAEVRGLVLKGFKEIVLTGICLGAWGRDFCPLEVADGLGFSGAGLSDVLKALAGLSGEFRIRLSSIELKYVTEELIGLIASDKKFCRHLHIPLQSGDDEVLKRMNRAYTTGEYKAVVDNIRREIKDVAITTDIMVGFPGETDSNFRNTVNFIKEIVPARSHIFSFSKREGTIAYGMGPEVRNDVIKKRYYELKTVALGASYIYRRMFLNETLEVLVETKRDKRSGFLTGYSDNYIKVFLNGTDDLMRKIVPVRIEDLNLLYTIGAYPAAQSAESS